MTSRPTLERSELAARLLATQEALRVKARLPSKAVLLELLSTDPELRGQLASTHLRAEQVADELFRKEWLKATLEEVSKDVMPLEQHELENFYRRYPERWLVPEKRKLRHILITVQDRFIDNTEQTARLRIDEVKRKLDLGADFGTLALEVSECPTAMDQALLGWIQRGQLYKELDAAAFELDEGEVSVPIRTTMGWHIVQCLEVVPEHIKSFSNVEAKLRSTLLRRRQLSAQKRWVQTVLAETHHVN